MEKLNEDFKSYLGNILALSACDPAAIDIVRNWDFNNPSEKDLLTLQQCVMNSVDSVKSRLANCTTTKVKVGDPERYN